MFKTLMACRLVVEKPFNQTVQKSDHFMHYTYFAVLATQETKLTTKDVVNQ